MKKILFILVCVLISCSTDKSDNEQQQQKCYNIIAKGYDNRGDFIIIKYSDYNNKRYKVANYLDWININKLCEPITLTQEPL